MEAIEIGSEADDGGNENTPTLRKRRGSDVVMDKRKRVRISEPKQSSLETPSIRSSKENTPVKTSHRVAGGLRKNQYFPLPDDLRIQDIADGKLGEEIDRWEARLAKQEAKLLESEDDW
ncbi:hypothetical protein ACJ73_07394 [Blastomyces percursus]|uniref:Uncharacterized protein n=1 Tax=Blastomyces percursus TaxID=1658174 RepID=A0A1J9PY71_9EURO|nr:hypothetical protein ACJ73_07394 [Blastomyces percursus]